MTTRAANDDQQILEQDLLEQQTRCPMERINIQDLQRINEMFARMEVELQEDIASTDVIFETGRNQRTSTSTCLLS
jgi:hypothetical protein